MAEDKPETFADALRQYFQKYPESSPKHAALASCWRLGLPTFGSQFQKKLNEARQIKLRLKRRKLRFDAIQSDRSGIKKGVVNGAVEVDVHRVVFSGTMPSWLKESVARAAKAEFAGWRVANDRTGLLVCELEKLGFRPYRIIAYRSSGLMTVYPGRRRYDDNQLKIDSLSNMIQVFTELGPEDRRRAGELEKSLQELSEFCNEVFAQRGGHAAFKVAGIRNAAPFKIRVKSRGLNVRHDGSHPDCIELEIDPQGADVRAAIKENREAIREVHGLTESLIVEAKKRDDLMGEIGSGLKELAIWLKAFGHLLPNMWFRKKVGSHQANPEAEWD